MLRLNTPYAISICNTFVDFTIHPESAYGGDTPARLYVVDYAVRQAAKPTQPDDVSVTLEDADQKALLAVEERTSCMDPVRVKWGRLPGSSEHFQSRFYDSGRKLTWIVVAYRGERRRLPIDADWHPGGGREEPAPPVPTGEAPEKRREDRKAKQKCCPLVFNAPAGPRMTTPTAGAAATTYACAPWAIVGVFDDTKPCECTCCEYRQHVRGSVDLRIVLPAPIGPIVVRRFSPVFRYIVVFQLFGFPVFVPVGLGPNFEEDTIAIGPFLRDAYGHRTPAPDPSDPGVQFTVDPGYITECVYVATDSPQLTLPNVFNGLGLTLNIDVEFRGQIIDTCAGGVSSGPNLWNWRFTAVL